MSFSDKLKSKLNKNDGIIEKDIEKSQKWFIADEDKKGGKKSDVKVANYKSKEEYLKSKKTGKILQSTFRATLITFTGTTIAFTLATVIDGVLIGQFLNANAIAAHGLATPFFFVMTAISEVFSTGTQARCANLMGRGDMKKANSAFNASLLLCVIIGAIVFIAGALFRDHIATLLGANKSTPQMEEIFRGTSGYICGLALGCPFYLLFNVIQPFMQLDGNSKRVIPAIIICSVVNIIGDLFNIFVLKWGMFGMALATSAGFLTGLLYLLPHFWSEKSHYSISIKNIAFRGYLSVINTGLPKAASKALFIVRSVLINGILLGIAGSVGVAALSIQSNCYTVFGCVIIAQGFTTILLTNIYYGEHDKTGLLQLLRSNFVVSIFVVGAIMFLLIILAPVVARIYTSDPEVIECTTNAIQLMALSMPFYSINLVLENFAQGTGRIKFTYVILVIDHFALILFFAYVLTPVFGINGLWISFVICEPIMLIGYLIYVMIKKKKVKITLEDIIMLDESFDVPNNQKFEYSITDIEDVMMASLGAEVCCMRNKIDTRRVNTVSLCIEEMAKSIVEHGIKNQTKQRVDVKVIIENKKTDGHDQKTITIRLRDNCPTFNLVDYHKEMATDNPMEGIGISMIFKAAKDVNYFSAMNLNYLVIKI